MSYTGAELSDLEVRCLEAFPEWLKRLATDSEHLLRCATTPGVSQELQKNLLSALNYLFKSLDLIPDGIEDLGYLDDALVFRALVSVSSLGEEPDEALSRLKTDSELIREFLEQDYERLTRYVRSLAEYPVRGRSVEDLVADPDVLSAFSDELSDWAANYVAPGFSRDEKNLVKLRSFLQTKLPA